MAQHEHVLVMRTLSKFGLAGVRLGYMAGAADLIAQVDKVRPPYNISVLNAEATLFALEHADEYARQAALLVAERQRLQAALRDMPGVEPFPSDANMILVRVADATPEKVPDDRAEPAAAAPHVEPKIAGSLSRIITWVILTGPRTKRINV
jgi:histidinol-phosphate aminotransferase